MKKTTILLATLLLMTIIHATNIPSECKEGGTQMQMNKCAHDEFLKADKELNVVYQELREVKKEDELFLKNLKKAQKAWLAYRDADLDAQFTCESDDLRQCFGSKYGVLLNGVKTELTLQRIKILKGQLPES